MGLPCSQTQKWTMCPSVSPEASLEASDLTRFGAKLEPWVEVRRASCWEPGHLASNSFILEAQSPQVSGGGNWLCPPLRVSVRLCERMQDMVPTVCQALVQVLRAHHLIPHSYQPMEGHCHLI